MDTNQTALERAFELAKSGKFATVSDLRAHLGREGYQANQVEGPALGRQLRQLIRKSRDAGGPQREANDIEG